MMPTPEDKMALTPTQRRVLGLAQRKGGLPLSDLTTRTQKQAVRHLITEDLATGDNTTLIATTAGRKLYRQPIHKREPVRIMVGARMPHPDPTHRGTVPEPEIVDPRPADIRRARDLGAQQRASFRADLEKERKLQRQRRVQRMFKQDAA